MIFLSSLLINWRSNIYAVITLFIFMIVSLVIGFSLGGHGPRYSVFFILLFITAICFPQNVTKQNVRKLINFSFYCAFIVRVLPDSLLALIRDILLIERGGHYGLGASLFFSEPSYVSLFLCALIQSSIFVNKTLPRNDALKILVIGLLSFSVSGYIVCIFIMSFLFLDGSLVQRTKMITAGALFLALLILLFPDNFFRLLRLLTALSLLYENLGGSGIVEFSSRDGSSFKRLYNILVLPTVVSNYPFGVPYMEIGSLLDSTGMDIPKDVYFLRKSDTFWSRGPTAVITALVTFYGLIALLILYILPLLANRIGKKCYYPWRVKLLALMCFLFVGFLHGIPSNPNSLVAFTLGLLILTERGKVA